MNAKENLGDVVYFHNCGLLLSVVPAQMSTTKSNAKENLGEKSGRLGICLSFMKASAKQTANMFMSNHSVKL